MTDPSPPSPDLAGTILADLLEMAESPDADDVAEARATAPLLLQKLALMQANPEPAIQAAAAELRPQVEELKRRLAID